MIISDYIFVVCHPEDVWSAGAHQNQFIHLAWLLNGVDDVKYQHRILLITRLINESGIILVVMLWLFGWCIQNSVSTYLLWETNISKLFFPSQCRRWCLHEYLYKSRTMITIKKPTVNKALTKVKTLVMLMLELTELMHISSDAAQSCGIMSSLSSALCE